ncbi:OmpA family protein [Ferrimonas pelagia]|uniref:OmpA family protein n=1 Tax=Ferrimonas pelagia TaxID=1177826 RepID=UPI0031EDD9D0
MVTLLLVQGCSAWPEEGRGGYGEQSSMWDPYVASPAHVYEQRRQHERLAHAQLQLDLLKLRGAYHCTPGRLTQAELRASRLRRELMGALYADAEETLLLLEDELFRLSVRLNQLRRQTHCAAHPDHQFAAQGPLPQPMVQGAAPVAVERWQQANEIMLCDNQFAVNEAQLLPDLQRQLGMLAQELSQEPDLVAYVLGHTDTDGSAQSNQQLAQRRADAVKQGLIELGTDPEQVKTLALGEMSPLVAELDGTAKLQNRRVEIRVGRRAQPLPQTGSPAEGADPQASMRLKHWPNGQRSFR